MQFHNGLLHSIKVVYFIRWFQNDNTDTFTVPEHFWVQIPPVPTLCCGHILTCLLRVVSHKKDRLAPDSIHRPILKPPSFLKKQHSMLAPYLKKPNGLIRLKILLFLVYQLSFSTSCHKKYFLCCNYAATINSWWHLFKIHKTIHDFLNSTWKRNKNKQNHSKGTCWPGGLLIAGRKELNYAEL